MKPIFSICHTTARPQGWQDAYHAWIMRAAVPESIEYVLCVDERWGFEKRADGDTTAEGMILPPFGTREPLKALHRLVWNEGPKTAVSGWNTAARASTGRVLLCIADDFFPCKAWDLALLEALTSHSDVWEDKQIVIWVSEGTPADAQGHICHPIMSRARYEHQGSNTHCPEYDGVCSDDDFTAHARQDGVILDASHIRFEHRHPGYGPGGFSPNNPLLDQAFWHHNKPEDYARGKAIFERRKRAKFGHGAVAEQSAPMDLPSIGDRSGSDTDPSILGMCLPGERFEGAWVMGMLRLHSDLVSRGLNILFGNEFLTNVYVTRIVLAKAMLALPVKPKLILSIDDDNILTGEQYDRLVKGLNDNPDAMAIAGWCWVHFEEEQRFFPSCGYFREDGKLGTLDPITFPAQSEPMPIEWTGFPVILMRYELLERLGWRAFLPILDDRLDHGLTGEDHAFCKRALDAGYQILVDPQVEVPHMKYRAIQPEFRVVPKNLAKEDPKIIGMIRAHNEARWIDRSVRSLLPFCKAVYVMDDKSTDETARVAHEAGAIVFPSPFPEGLDEARDKQFLQAEVLKDHPDTDWIICIDGDEELERNAGQLIRHAIRKDIADCFFLPFIHLWDTPEQMRTDRWYTNFYRRSLYRPIPGIEFRSLYSGAGVNVHAGLHTGNAPESIREAGLGVRIIHYGYMLKADRIRKWRKYNHDDPGNMIEDQYRHCVQGDVPEVPADLVLKHAGPLKLERVPARFIPEGFDAEKLKPLDAEVMA